MNVAFSRDQENKIYVQHKMVQHASEFFQWIDSGAIVYLCGAKGPMNDDVEAAIREIIQKEKNCSAENAAQYFQNMKKNGQYHKEVY
jgi:sulfite reductase (NADPH) flavoprotein alpha-component